MAHALALTREKIADPLDIMRGMIVFGCALALIVAG